MKLTGGIIAYIIDKEKSQFYYGENSYWLLDDWRDELENESYLQVVEKLKIDVASFAKDTALKYLPQVIIDIENKSLQSSYYDQALENRVPATWKGKWVKNPELLLEEIPIKDRYWLKEST